MLSRSLALVVIVTISFISDLNAENTMDLIERDLEPEYAPGPCADTGKELIRSVTCADGFIWHICRSSIHQSASILKSREKWFEKVLKYSSSTGPGCMRRILCEVACKDGINGVSHLNYPEVLSFQDNSTEAQTFVEAYIHGEQLSCGSIIGPDSTKIVTNNADCVNYCSRTFFKCGFDMRVNLQTRAIYDITTVGDKLGMFVFSVIWWMDDGKPFEIDSVKTKFTHFLEHMNKLKKDFDSYLEKAGDFDFNKRESLWESFLRNYKDSSKLKEILAGQVGYSNFLYYRFVTAEIVATYNTEHSLSSQGTTFFGVKSVIHLLTIIVILKYFTD